ncbi:MAG: M48 family metallopeptidase [Lawsonibacter sp.]|nr:M48 family metallopeptidase [Lawsonibacter sp.]
MVKKNLPQLRMVDTPEGPLTYTLTRKAVKNLNLRIGTGGEIVVSLPLRCSVRFADDFVRGKSGWILDVLSRRKAQQAEPLPPVSREECTRRLSEALERMYPLVQPYGVVFPSMKLRALKSQWGNCHWAQGYITLNTALARCPEELRNYVALHELVHFLHHDHGPGFCAQMNTLMPDWRERRKALKRYSGSLEG